MESCESSLITRNVENASSICSLGLWQLISCGIMSQAGQHLAACSSNANLKQRNKVELEWKRLDSDGKKGKRDKERERESGREGVRTHGRAPKTHQI